MHPPPHSFQTDLFIHISPARYRSLHWGALMLSHGPAHHTRTTANHIADPLSQLCHSPTISHTTTHKTMCIGNHQSTKKLTRSQNRRRRHSRRRCHSPPAPVHPAPPRLAQPPSCPSGEMPILLAHCRAHASPVRQRRLVSSFLEGGGGQSTNWLPTPVKHSLHCFLGCPEEAN